VCEREGARKRERERKRGRAREWETERERALPGTPPEATAAPPCRPSSSSSLLLSSLELSDTKVYEPLIRAHLGTAAHFCEVGVRKLRTVDCPACAHQPSRLDQIVHFHPRICLARPWNSQGLSIYSTICVPGATNSNFADALMWSDREGWWAAVGLPR